MGFVWMLICALATTSSATVTELPGTMQGCMSSQVYATVMKLPSSSELDLLLRAKYCNDPSRSVSLLWSYTSGGNGGSEEFVVPVNNEPTAIARRAVQSDTLYVVGWLERTGQSVVYEWTFGEGALLTTIDPAGEEVVTFVPPSYISTRVFLSQPGQLGPAWGVAPYAEAGSLLYLAHDGAGRDRSLWSIDVASGSVAFLHSSLAEDGLAGGRSISGGLSVDEGRVFVVSRVGPFGTNAGGSSWKTFVLQDEDVDGVIDVTQTMTQAELAASIDGPWLDSG